MKVLGIDIGGSGIKGAPVDLQRGDLLAERLRLPTPRPATPAAVSATVAEIVRAFDWQGQVGCGLPAVVQNGTARTAANIDPAWIGTDAARLFSTATGCPVSVMNDADAAGLAEMQFGAGRDKGGTVLMITIGTGLGSALFRDGALVPNTELGHLRLEGTSAEEYASAAVLSRLRLSYQQWAQRFDLYLHRLQDLFWPDLFVIGGEISKDHEQFFPHLTVETEVVPAELRNNAGIVGAALAISPTRPA